MKKILAMMLTAAMMLSMGTAAMAANQDARFTKTYKSTNGEANPAETFTFTYTAYDLTDSNANLDVDDMPAIPNSTIEFKEGTATAAGYEQDVAVALSDITWPGVGVYYYKVNEVEGDTLGVTYDTDEAFLKVTVAYDEGTNTYYTAFVTLSLKDEKGKINDDGTEVGDGITDSKIAGFENVYDAGDLTVKKNVTGNLGDISKDFEVKVTFTNSTGKAVNSTITYTSDATVEGDKDTGSVVFAEGATTAEVTLNLKHNESVVFDNIPYGITYTVEESDYTTEANGAYDAAKYALNDGTATTNKVENEELDAPSEKVEITNNKGTTVDTGISVDSIPYIAMLGVVAVGGAGFMVSKKRRSED